MTQAGHIVQAVAESLFGAVLHQLRVPGAPLLTGMGPVKLDMNTFQALYNSAEYYTTILGITEMAKWLDIPNWGYAGTSDSQCVDANAGIDITELTLLSMQAGSNLNPDIGYLDVGGMVRATEKTFDRFCLACFNGEYPIPVDPKLDKFIMERRRSRNNQLIERPQAELFPLQ